MTPILLQKLDEFRQAKEVFSKGKLATVLFLTRRIADDGLPFAPETLRTVRQGQVAGLGREPVQKILAEHGVVKVLAEEGGRTSRGSLGLAEDYVELLNGLFKEQKLRGSELKEIESWWVTYIKELFNRQCFKVNLDKSLTISAFVTGLLESARERQAEVDGLRLEGAVLHYLVGAKLRLKFPKPEIKVRGFSVADDVSADKGDFSIGDTVVHVTTAPSEKLFAKCKSNIKDGLRPLIVCPKGKVVAAGEMSEIAGLVDRVEIFDAAMFVSTNINERGFFKAETVQQSVHDLILAYNDIIDKTDSDGSLKIAPA